MPTTGMIKWTGRGGGVGLAGLVGPALALAVAVGVVAQPASPVAAGPGVTSAIEGWRLTPVELALPTTLSGVHPVAMRLAKNFRGQALCYVVLLRDPPSPTFGQSFENGTLQNETFRFHLATLPVGGGAVRLIQSVTTRGTLEGLEVIGDRAVLSGFAGLVVMSPGRIQRHGFGPLSRPWPDGKGENRFPVRVAVMEAWALIEQGGKLSLLNLDTDALITVVDAAGPAAEFGLSGQPFSVSAMVGDPARGRFWLGVSSNDRPDLSGVFSCRPDDPEPVKAFAGFRLLPSFLLPRVADRTLLTGPPTDRTPHVFVLSEDGTRLIEVSLAALHTAWPDGLNPDAWAAASLGPDALALLKPGQLRLVDGNGIEHAVETDHQRRAFVRHPDPGSVLLLSHDARGPLFAVHRLDRRPDAGR